MKRNVTFKGIDFHIANYTPRKNEYERGLKYKLFVAGIPTSYCFCTIREARNFISKNYFMWL